MQDLERAPVVITGPNGAGKTNILEAVSLLSPGRGLRGAKLQEMQRSVVCDNPPLDLPPFQGGKISTPWAVSSEIETAYGPVKIGTGLDPETDKRIVRINGETARGQSALAEYLSCVWLTPQMDRLFIDSAGTRRRFLDRLVFTFDPGHTGRVTRYENALSQRSKLLREGRADPAWLAGLESQMAETGIAITAARIDYLYRLQQAAGAAIESESLHFPKARFALEGALENALKNKPALETEEFFLKSLQSGRERDSIVGGAGTGPHRSDLAVTYAEKNMAADQCSTGEQKALLIGIMLAHARLLAAEHGAPPVLLLDEVAAHLDDNRRAALYDILLGLGAQVWMTGTDESLFAGLRRKAQLWEIMDMKIKAL